MKLKVQYFRATDNSELQEIYDEIDTLEKQKLKSLNITTIKKNIGIYYFSQEDYCC